MALITLQHSSINSGNKVAVICSTVTVSYSKNNVNNPSENYSEDTPVVKVQSKSVGNPIYNLQRVNLDYPTTYHTYTPLSQELLKQFLMLPNTDSDPIYLNIIYGTSTNWKSLEKYSSARVSDIPVTINGNLSVTLDVTDSEDAYLPTTNITLLEVKKV